MSQFESNQAFSTLTSRCCVLGSSVGCLYPAVGGGDLTGSHHHLTQPRDAPVQHFFLKLRNHNGDAKAG